MEQEAARKMAYSQQMAYDEAQQRAVVLSHLQEKETMAECQRYSEKTDETDAVLAVEGEMLHINKTILLVTSPVFKVMFKGCIPSEIPLPGKKFMEVRWLLDYLYPGVCFQMTYEKAVKLLPLADEYGIPSLSKECMDVLIKQEQPVLNIVALAEKYGNSKNLVAAIELCVTQIPAHTISMQRRFPENANISKDHIIKIYEKKIERFKQQTQDGRNARWL